MWTCPPDKFSTIIIVEFQDDYVAIGASGGKDSTVLAYIMKTLNDRYDYGLKLVLLSIDEGITGKASNKYILAKQMLCVKYQKIVFLQS